MIFFILDACAIARIYFPDIGTKNMLSIYNYPNSKMLAPNFAYSEAISALISTLNQRLIDQSQYRLAYARLTSDFSTHKIRATRISDAHINLSARLLEKHKMQPGRMRLSGADSIYLAMALRLSMQIKRFDGRVILVTSDGALYNSACDESSIETFHFWTCNLGCGCGTTIIPIKGDSNSCLSCGKTCAICRIDLCPSTYSPRF